MKLCRAEKPKAVLGGGGCDFAPQNVPPGASAEGSGHPWHLHPPSFTLPRPLVSSPEGLHHIKHFPGFPPRMSGCVTASGGMRVPPQDPAMGAQKKFRLFSLKSSSERAQLASHMIDSCQFPVEMPGPSCTPSLFWVLLKNAQYWLKASGKRLFLAAWRAPRVSVTAARGSAAGVPQVLWQIWGWGFSAGSPRLGFETHPALLPASTPACATSSRSTPGFGAAAGWGDAACLLSKNRVECFSHYLLDFLPGR